VWLSEHKAGVFAVAFAMLALAGVLLWRARSLPCPADPALAHACARLRRASIVLWVIALLCVMAGALFAFVLPAVG
jgi:hypothetical protein